MSESRASVINFSTRRVYVSQDAEDSVLIERCRQGDPDAFEPIVERYQRLLFTVALRMLGNHDEANDAAQNAFVKAYEKLDTFDASRRFFSWIYRILLNECLNVRRDRHPHEQLTPELATVDSPVEQLENAERRRRVQAAVRDLPHEQREVIVLRHFTELSYDEIAEVLGIPAKTVKSRLHTARQHLGQILALDSHS
jgi:RNA polymerase sigma-70 factor (ECF subfamily)